MASERVSSITLPLPSQSGRRSTPPPSQLRQRPRGRTATFADADMPLDRRRSSLFSENLSETRKSIRTTTDDLLLPRVAGGAALEGPQEPSHLHSIPLGLALLPAVGGLFFQNGSAVVTDITLLILAAIFLNWSVRLPWYVTSTVRDRELAWALTVSRDWYFSAQATRFEGTVEDSVFDTTAKDGNQECGTEEALASSEDTSSIAVPETGSSLQSTGLAAISAQGELQMHEVLALMACFAFPAVGAWLLHAIRSQLSRPSEGLVSNYNLTIFLLASEIRPLSHLVKMVLSRTLYLQRVVNANAVGDGSEANNVKVVLSLTKRIEELEAHLAEADEDQGGRGVESAITKKTNRVTSEVRKTVQPELDALNRAVRRYEKRTTISALQTEGRLQDLESRLKDVVVLAAAAQRNAESQPRNYIAILANWLCGGIVLPLQCLWLLFSIPVRATNGFLRLTRKFLGLNEHRFPKEQRSGKYGGTLRLREKKAKG